MSFKYKKIGNVRFGNELEDILKLKGIQNVNLFLNPTKNQIENVLLYDNIEQAKDCLIQHIESNDEIDLVVDSDVDGYTSAALMYQYIKEINNNVKINYYIHNTKTKSHGLKDVCPQIINSSAKLLIVPDASTGDYLECSKIITSGKDIIILDHHKVEPKTNPAIIINNQLSNNIIDKSLTGVGVCYKFIKFIDDYYKIDSADKYIDLVAFGMIADRANLHNLESRYFVLQGLKQIQLKNNYNKLLKIFVDSVMYSMNYKVTINGIGFYVAPLLNSLIRLGSYEDQIIAFKAMCNIDEKINRKVRGKGIVNMSIQEYTLKSCQSAKRLQQKLTNKSVEMLSKDIEQNNLDKYSILVCNASDKIDNKSTGLIANTLSNKYQRPCLLMKRYNDVCSGSGRGFEKCEILDFNEWCKSTNLFDKVEGHPNAFGCSISYQNTYDLFDLISKMPKINEPTYLVYNEYTDKNISSEIIKSIAKYNYVWGCGVDEPLFLIKNVTCNSYGISLLGLRCNKLQFMYHNIKFIKMTRGSSLNKLYNDIVNTGDNIKFDIIGKFNIDNGMAEVIIEDMSFEKSEKTNMFGF